MSDTVTALGGAVSGDGITRIEEVGLQGMITLRGDLSDPRIRKAATGVAGVDMPLQGYANSVDDRGIFWMSPDELLVLCPYDQVAQNIARMEKTLADAHGLVVDVSDARASFRVSGPHAREVIAKLAPVDLSPENFSPGEFRRTRLAQVSAAFWMPDEETFQIICFRSQAAYVFDLLKVAAQPGSAVGVF